MVSALCQRGRWLLLCALTSAFQPVDHFISGRRLVPGRGRLLCAVQNRGRVVFPVFQKHASHLHERGRRRIGDRLQLYPSTVLRRRRVRRVPGKAGGCAWLPGPTAAHAWHSEPRRDRAVGDRRSRIARCVTAGGHWRLSWRGARRLVVESKTAESSPCKPRLQNIARVRHSSRPCCTRTRSSKW